MWRRVYRQRRRLLIGFGLFTAVGLYTVPVFHPADLWLALLALPAAMTLGFALLIALQPRWGMAVEILALTILVQEALISLSPALEAQARTATPLVRLLLWFFIYYLLFNLATGLNRIAWPGTLTLTARRVIARPAAAVWQAMVLAPGHPHWDPDVAAVGATVGDAVELVPAAPTGPVRPGTTERVLELDPGRYRRSLRQAPREAPDDPVPAIDERLHLAPHAGGTEVTLVRVCRGVPLMTALRLWLEDHAGDALDDFAAVLEERANWSLSATRRQRRLRRPAPTT